MSIPARLKNYMDLHHLSYSLINHPLTQQGSKAMSHKTTHKKAGTGKFWIEGDLKAFALKNEFFRRVVFTGTHSQLVLMNIPKGERSESGYLDADRIIFIVRGKGKSVLDGRKRDIVRHDVVFVPEGSRHSLVNPTTHDLKVVVVYAPPVFADGKIHATLEDVLAEKESSYRHAWEQ
jgi:mannose-6-phosphate isomerase-like protein (cupin superfamily)